MRLGLLNREQLNGALAETFDAFIGQIQESWQTEHALNGRHTGVNASEYVSVGTRLLLKGYTTELSTGLSQMNSDQWSIDPTRVSVVRLQPSANLAITGIPIFDEFTRGQILLFLNVSAFAVTFKYENSGSPETHRLYTPDQLDMLVPRTGGAVLAWYDTDNLRWRVLPFQAGLVSGTNTGDQLLFKTVAVSGQSDIVADTTTDTLTVASGRTAVVITTTAGSDTLTISISDMVGDSGSGGVAGLVPAPASGDAAAGKFLKASGAWAVPPSSSVGQLLDVVFKRKASDESVTSSTVLQDDDDLTFSVLANQVWMVDIWIYVFSASSTPRMNYRLSTPTGSTVKTSQDNIIFSTAANSGSVDLFSQASASEPNTYVSSSGPGGSAQLVKMHAMVVVGANNGTIKLQWSQNVSNGNPTIVQANSHLRAERYV